MVRNKYYQYYLEIAKKTLNSFQSIVLPLVYPLVCTLIRENPYRLLDDDSNNM